MRPDDRAARWLGLLLAALAIWLSVFFASAYALVGLIEAFEDRTSECSAGECDTFAEFIDDHDLLTAVLLAVFAALPAVALLWKEFAGFANRA